MNKLNVHIATFLNAPTSFKEKATLELNKFLGANWIETSNDSADVVWFMTGGSEKQAIECTASSHFAILVGNNSDNAYAAASEVKSYRDAHHLDGIILNATKKTFASEFQAIIKVVLALKSLKNKKVGLLGDVSDWLVNSDIDPQVLKEKFQIELERFAWKDMPSYKKIDPNNLFISTFNKSKFDLTDTSRVFSVIDTLIQKEKLDAITVECFSLVKSNSVTACLPLARLNDMGIPAGCEGDICSIVGMMVVKELTGSIPWMANLASVNSQSITFAHCTVPLSKLNSYEITTHFETGVGTAIKGQWDKKPITIFRLNRELNKAFISRATIVGIPEIEHACRTQIEVELSEKALNLLGNNPLGNHHLILEGDYTDILTKMCFVKQIEVV